jgi:hypothetical protein
MRTMRFRLRARGLLAAVAIAGLAGCGSAATGGARQVPPARLAYLGHSRSLSVVLTPLGAQRIGIETIRAVAQGSAVVIPYRALLYEADGQTAVYVQVSALAYTREFVTVATINGDSVLLTSGLRAGSEVVIQGGEELLGVQNGVGVET